MFQSEIEKNENQFKKDFRARIFDSISKIVVSIKYSIWKA